PGPGDEVDPGVVQPLVDLVHLLAAKVGVPARQAVLDLAVGPRVLVDHDAEDAPTGELEGHLGARHASADDQDDVLRAHDEAPHPRRARPGLNPTPWPVAPVTRWPTRCQVNDLARRTTSPGDGPETPLRSILAGRVRLDKRPSPL